MFDGLVWRISSEQLDEFELAIALACFHKSPRPLTEEECRIDVPLVHELPRRFQTAQGEVVISFNGDWEPFLTETRGYNRPKQRWFVPGGGDILYAVGNRLQASPTTEWVPGGRVFLNPVGACRRPEGTDEEWLAFWSLPRDSRYLGRRPPPDKWPPTGA
jgi:hypothetical protein